MSILVSGSVAFDHIMTFPQRFKDQILPEKLDDLNVSFNITHWETHFGGTGGNIGFCLQLLGEQPLILAAVGSDFGPYGDWFDRHEMSRAGLQQFDDVRSPQGFVTNDLDGNQMWNFFEGAMSRAHEARVEDIDAPLSFAIVSANGKQAMVDHARALKRLKVPTFIDPSHGLPILDREEILELIDGCAAYIVNDYEWSLTLDKTGLSEQEIISRCDAVIITKGKSGSRIHQGEVSLEIPPVTAQRVVEPTGCGDAYRAGLICGRARGLSWEIAGRMGSLLGTWQVEYEGTQNLKLDLNTFRDRYEREFGSGF
jgi:adenosine kinase